MAHGRPARDPHSGEVWRGLPWTPPGHRPDLRCERQELSADARAGRPKAGHGEFRRHHRDLKKAELLALSVADFGFSNRYQPEVWVKHTGRQVFKDRRLKLPPQIIPVLEDYVARYGITEALFPYTPRHVEEILTAVAKQACISKRVTVSVLRDLFVVRSVKRGMKLEDVFEKIGLAKTSYDDARKKYGRVTSEHCNALLSA
jgi:hypothetical protein